MSVGVKETKELLVGVNEVGLALVERLKDGVQLTDAVAFYEKLVSDPAFKSKVFAAYENWQAVPDEVKDLDVGEAVELAGVQLGYIPKYVALVAG